MDTETVQFTTTNEQGPPEVHVLKKVSKNIYSLNNHNKELVKCLTKLWGTSTYCDATLHADGREFRVHRFVLHAGSPYFARLIKKNMDVENFYIKFSGGEALEIVLRYLYSGIVVIKPEYVTEILTLSQVLEIPSLESICFDNAMKHTCKRFPRKRVVCSRVKGFDGITLKVVYEGQTSELDQSSKLSSKMRRRARTRKCVSKGEKLKTSVNGMKRKDVRKKLNISTDDTTRKVGSPECALNKTMLMDKNLSPNERHNTSAETNQYTSPFGTIMDGNTSPNERLNTSAKTTQYTRPLGSFMNRNPSPNDKTCSHTDQKKRKDNQSEESDTNTGQTKKRHSKSLPQTEGELVFKKFTAEKGQENNVQICYATRNQANITSSDPMDGTKNESEDRTMENLLSNEQNNLQYEREKKIMTTIKKVITEQVPDTKSNHEDNVNNSVISQNCKDDVFHCLFRNKNVTTVKQPGYADKNISNELKLSEEDEMTIRNNCNKEEADVIGLLIRNYSELVDALRRQNVERIAKLGNDKCMLVLAVMNVVHCSYNFHFECCLCKFYFTKKALFEHFRKKHLSILSLIYGFHNLLSFFLFNENSVDCLHDINLEDEFRLSLVLLDKACVEYLSKLEEEYERWIKQIGNPSVFWEVYTDMNKNTEKNEKKKEQVNAFEIAQDCRGQNKTEHKRKRAFIAHNNTYELERPFVPYVLERLSYKQNNTYETERPFVPNILKRHSSKQRKLSQTFSKFPSPLHQQIKTFCNNSKEQNLNITEAQSSKSLQHQVYIPVPYVFSAKDIEHSTNPIPKDLEGFSCQTLEQDLEHSSNQTAGNLKHFYRQTTENSEYSSDAFRIERITDEGNTEIVSTGIIRTEIGTGMDSAEIQDVGFCKKQNVLLEHPGFSSDCEKIKQIDSVEFLTSDEQTQLGIKTEPLSGEGLKHFDTTMMSFKIENVSDELAEQDDKSNIVIEKQRLFLCDPPGVMTEINSVASGLSCGREMGDTCISLNYNENTVIKTENINPHGVMTEIHGSASGLSNVQDMEDISSNYNENTVIRTENIKQETQDLMGYSLP